MARWSSKTMDAIATLAGSVDGNYSIHLRRHDGKPPNGDQQEYEGPPVAGVKHEWVDQRGPGISGDDYAGTVTFVLGEFHLLVEYAS
jgi:hypothetical protein